MIENHLALWRILRVFVHCKVYISDVFWLPDLFDGLCVCELTMYLELVFWSLLIYRELRSNQQLQHLHSMRSADLLWLWCYVFTKCRAIRKLCSKSLEKANSTLCKAVQNKFSSIYQSNTGFIFILLYIRTFFSYQNSSLNKIFNKIYKTRLFS